jgi:hypothetical protein
MEVMILQNCTLLEMLIYLANFLDKSKNSLLVLRLDFELFEKAAFQIFSFSVNSPESLVSSGFE